MKISFGRTGFFVLLFLLISTLSAAGADSIRMRTFVSMEPYGRMTVTNWGLPDQVETWNTTYGFTPGMEIYAVLSDRVELGGGFRWQINRRVLRSGGADDERFSFVPVYLAGRFALAGFEEVRMYGVVRAGYAFFLEQSSFRAIWLDEGSGALTGASGFLYAGAGLGITLPITEKDNWALDYSMDAGYAYHGAVGRNSSGSFPIAYHSITADFSLDWRF